jgi:ketosteroid isomerase-like protein
VRDDRLITEEEDPMGDWLEDYYADVDAMRMDAFIDHHTDDAILTFANNPPAVGKDQIREAIGGLWSSIGGLRHEIKRRYGDDDRAIIEAVTHYTRQDGSVVSIPSASALGRRDGKVESLTIYMDLAPLFAPAEAEPASA